MCLLSSQRGTHPGRGGYEDREYVRADGDGDIQLVLELWVHDVLVGPGGWSGWELIVGWCLRRKFYIERRASPGPKRSLGTGRTDDLLSP